MNGKEKMRAALAHTEGPVPFDLGATPVSGAHISVVRELRQWYGLAERPVKLTDPMQMLGEIDDELREAMGIDTVSAAGKFNIYGFANENYKPWRTPWGQEILVPGDFNVTEANGKVYMYPKGDTSVLPCAAMSGGGYFFDTIIRQNEIDDDNLNPEDNLEEFGDITDAELAHYRQLAAQYANSDRAVVAGVGGLGLGDIALVPGTMLTAPKGIRDVEEWYMSTVLRPDYLHEVFTKQVDIALRNLAKIQPILGELPLAVYACGTDFGTQTSTFCSGSTFSELYMPHYKRFTGWIHEHTGWKIFKHSCGAVEGLMPLLAEAGFDILNPVQWTAAGMDRKLIKARHGQALTFWGGGVDTQKTMPFGTPEAVYTETTESLQILSVGGGFVCNTIHNLQAKTPVRNVDALVRALHDFNWKHYGE